MAISPSPGVPLKQQTYALMNPKAALGLDVAQAGACFHLTDFADRCLAAGTVDRSLDGWRRLQAVLTEQGIAAADCLAAIEATGDHHLPWCEALDQQGTTVFALNPLVAKRTTPVSNAVRDNKDDPIDAERMAHVLVRESAALTQFQYHSDPPLVGLRKIVAAHGAVRRVLTNLKKHTGAVRQLLFPQLESVGLTDLRMRRLLQAAPTAHRALALTQAELTTLVGDHAKQVRAVAQQAFVPAAIAEACVPALLALLSVIDQLEVALRAIERSVLAQAVRAVSAERLALAQTLPAFGPKTTPVVLAFIPPDLWQRAQSRKKKVARIQALFGIDPRRRQSGKWKGKIKLSKRGSRLARTAMYQIAMCSLIHDPTLLADYRRRTRVLKKPHKVAIYDIARKHLRRLVAVLESGVPFTPTSAPLAA